MMLLAVVIGGSVAAIALAVAIDAGTAYLAEKPSREARKSLRKSIDDNGLPAVGDEPEIKKGITAYRNLKRIETGLTKMYETPAKTKGQHRRLQVS